MQFLKPILLMTAVSSMTITAYADTETLREMKQDQLQVGLNAHYADAGYTDYDSSVAVVPTFFYDNDSVYARGNQLGYNFIKDDENELSVFAQYGGISYDADNANGAFAGLDDRDTSIMAGASYLRITPYGAIRGQAMADVMDKSGGKIGKLEYIARFGKDKLTVYPSVGVQWQDESYNDYYYGVTAKESAKTGIEQYSADSSFHPYAGLRATYDINQDWALFFNEKVAYNPDEVYDSPMVDSRISTATTAGVMYAF